jgi:hypothetical protein
MVGGHSEARQVPRAKLARAKEHLAQFQAEMATFLASAPYGYVETIEAGYKVWCLKIKNEPPERLGLIAGDVIHNTRASLDHLAAAFVQRGGGDINAASFPFQESAVGLGQTVRKKLPRASAAARRFVKRLKPYKGGNRTLVLLHSLDLADKHRALIPVRAAESDVTVTPVMRGFTTGLTPSIQLSNKTKSIANDGDKIFHFPAVLPNIGVPIDFQVLATFHVVLSDGAAVVGEPASATLKRLIDYAERIVSIAERRLLK